METGREWVLMQLADSAFPAGSLAHSGGLEAAWQHGEVRGPEALREWLEASLRQTGGSILPFVAEAHRETLAWAEVDETCDAWLSNHVANRASRQQGRSFWMASGHAFGFPDGGQDAPTPGHLAPIVGRRCRALGLGIVETARLLLFGQVRTGISAAIRLGLIGPLAAQGLQCRMAEAAEAWARRAPDLGLGDLAQTAPLLDLWQGAQDRFSSRLFQS